MKWGLWQAAKNFISFWGFNFHSFVFDFAFNHCLFTKNYLFLLFAQTSKQLTRLFPALEKSCRAKQIWKENINSFANGQHNKTKNNFPATSFSNFAFYFFLKKFFPRKMDPYFFFVQNSIFSLFYENFHDGFIRL